MIFLDVTVCFQVCETIFGTFILGAFLQVLNTVKLHFVVYLSHKYQSFFCHNFSLLHWLMGKLLSVNCVDALYHDMNEKRSRCIFWRFCYFSLK